MNKYENCIFILKGIEMATFKERLKELRKEKNLTQKELADHLKVPQGKISSWENGKLEPNIDKLIELAWELDSSLDYMLGQSDLNLGRNEDIEEKIKYHPSFTLLPQEEAELNTRIKEINDDFIKKYSVLTQENLHELTAKIQKANDEIHNKYIKDHPITHHSLKDDFILSHTENFDSISGNNLETTHSKSNKTDDNEKY